MKGNVTGHYVAVVPDEIEKVSSGGIVLAEDFDPNKKSRVEAASTRGTLVGIGPMAWKAYDGNDPDWKPWGEIGDQVWFQRHVAKVIEDKENLDKDGKPKKIFIMADENIIFNEGKADE
ncbi:MAG: hypothetical protein OEY29_14470 [Gammaproteobacteria bacterium]|nr:hypothetical protein [Gammaproteobacteria bacterium]